LSAHSGTAAGRHSPSGLNCGVVTVSAECASQFGVFFVLTTATGQPRNLPILRLENNVPWLAFGKQDTLCTSMCTIAHVCSYCHFSFKILPFKLCDK